jgi:hypothetical protein
MFSILRKVTIIVSVGLIIFLPILIILNTGIGTSASILKAEECSRYAFKEYSEYMEQSLRILLEAKIYLELSEDYSPATIAHEFSSLETRQKDISYPVCTEQLQVAQTSFLRYQALAYSAKAKRGFFSEIGYWYYKTRAEFSLNLTILIQTIIMPSVPLNENLFQNASLNTYYLGRDPF